MKHYPHVIVKIYEQEMYPVVVHIFYGKTLKEARGYLKSHMKTDEFMRDALNKGYWKDLQLHVEVTEHDGD